MRVKLKLVEGQYLYDILAQPRALADTVALLSDSKPLRSLVARIRNGRFRSVVLTGMGSSLQALHPLNNELIGLGLPAIMVETSELIHYEQRLFDPRTVFVAVSQSGRSAEIVRLLKVNRRQSPVIGVTNTGGSPLARNADAVVLTHAGTEASVSCKTYVTTLAALRWVGDLISDRELRDSSRDLRQASHAVESYLLHWRDHVGGLANSLDEVRNLFLVGRGNSLAAVGTGALIIKESTHRAAEGLSSAGFRHGPFEMVGPGTFVLVFGGDRKTIKLNQKLLGDIHAHRGKGEMVSHTSNFPPCALPAAPALIHPILEILPVQMMTLALAALTGREAGRFELASKITSRE